MERRWLWAGLQRNLREDGGPVSRCGCGGGQCTCTVQAGDGVTVSGSGSTANPFVISAEVSCETVRACVSAGPGLAYDQAAGVFSAMVSAQVGNNLTVGPNGLYVPTGSATVNTGCGLTGNGSGATPLRFSTIPCARTHRFPDL